MSEQSLNAILAKIKTTETINIWIPSLQTETPFRQLTLLQQKSIIDKISNSGYGLVDFFISVNEIIKNNCQDSSIYSQLTTIDRVNILVSLKRNLTQMYQGVDMQKLLDKNKTINLPPIQKTITTEKFEIEVSVPTLIEDSKLNSFLLSSYKEERQLLGKLLVAEICKFVNKITILENNTVIDLKDQTTKNKWTILENIESKNFKDLMDYITLTRNTEEEFVKIDDTTVEIGPELFVL